MEGTGINGTGIDGATVDNTAIEATGGSSAGMDFLRRALRNHGFWLSIGYVGLILLMARAYA